MLELTTAQPGKVSSLLWTLGSGLLHSGVVIKDKEYAYGGHDRRGITGVYWTRSVPAPITSIVAEDVHNAQATSRAAWRHLQV